EPSAVCTYNHSPSGDQPTCRRSPLNRPMSSSTTEVGAPTFSAPTSYASGGVADAWNRADRARTSQWSIVGLPVRMRGAVPDEPVVQETVVRAPAHAMTLVERRQIALERRQPVERHAGEVVVLEVIVGVEEREIPEPAAAHQRAPLRG